MINVDKQKEKKSEIFVQHMKDCNNHSGFMCHDRTSLPSTLPTNQVSPRGLEKTHATITLHVIVISNCEHLS